MNIIDVLPKSSFELRYLCPIDWKEVAYLHNSGIKYKNELELNCLFWEAFLYYYKPLCKYYDDFKSIPFEFLNSLIYKFNQHFPKSGRIENINYFDTLIYQFINEYQKNE